MIDGDPLHRSDVDPRNENSLRILGLPARDWRDGSGM